jgi:hypothetical protein
VTHGLRWSEAELVRYQARGSRVTDYPAARMVVPVAAHICVGPGQYQIAIDNLHTQTEKNSSEHWWTRARRARQQRTTVYRWLQGLLGLQCPVILPVTVTLTRVSPGTLDGWDNLQSALAHCTDAVADYLMGEYGKGNDRHPDLTWSHSQRKGAAGQYGVEIRLEGKERTEGGSDGTLASRLHA